MEEKKSENKPLLQPYEKSSQRLSIHEIILNNIVGGMAWSFGATIGVSLIIYFLTMLASNVDLVPIVGSFISKIIDFILAHNPNVGGAK